MITAMMFVKSAWDDEYDPSLIEAMQALMVDEMCLKIFFA